MGLVYKTSKWCDRLWSEHLDLSESGRNLVKAGIEKQGDSVAGFAADLHARLYLPLAPEVNDDFPEWAGRLHESAGELGEWHQLKLMTARNGFAAGIAAEVMYEQLLPHIPETPNTPSEGSSEGGQSDQPNAEQNDDSPTPSDSDIRATLRRATREARDAVQEAESSLEGLSSPLGFSASGTATVKGAGPADLKSIREAHSHLQSSDRLRQIAKLAGRMERVAATKAKSKIKPGVGEIHGIDLGSDLARLLPSELVNLKRPRLRLALLARLQERRALTYGMTGREPQGRGPIVVLLDESSSMRDDDRDIWSKAVCLALLSTATKQKRAWHLIAFNGSITREVDIPPGKGTSAKIQEALDHQCRGGTDFNAPVRRACEVIRTSKTMKQADVIIITDGEDELEPDAVEEVTALTRTEGVSWFVVGIGSAAAETCATSLGPISTSMFALRRLDDDDLIVPVINLEK